MSYLSERIEHMFDESRVVALSHVRRPGSYSRATSVSARDVAAVLRDRLPGLGTTKLHKLLYYCQGHHLAAFGEPLFAETISAWDNGPVVGTVWRAEKERGIVGTTCVLRDADQRRTTTQHPTLGVAVCQAVQKTVDATLPATGGPSELQGRGRLE